MLHQEGLAARARRLRLTLILAAIGNRTALALVADTDEIVRPSVVSLLKRCYPWDEPTPGAGGRAGNSAGGLGLPRFYALRLTLYKYGVHCDLGNSFDYGARAFSVRWLLSSYSHLPNASTESLSEKSLGFSHTREIRFPPVLGDAGWHMTSFGTATDLSRKLKGFLHSNIFTALKGTLRKAALAPDRLERCMRSCLDLSMPRGENADER